MIDFKFEDGEVNPLVRSIISSLVDAMVLIGSSREHHMFCIRSCDMVEMYEMQWILFYKDRFDEMDIKEREAQAQWYEWVSSVADLGKRQKELQYKDIIMRSVVFLSDIVENITESFLHACLKYYSSISGNEVENIPGYKRGAPDEYTKIRRCIRKWERSIASERSRLERFSIMIKSFFPNFILSDQKKSNIDILISKRNEITHELISVDNSRIVKIPTEVEVESYFNDVGDYVLSLLNAFVENTKFKSN